MSIEVLIHEQVFKWLEQHHGKSKLPKIIEKIEAFVEKNELAGHYTRQLFAGQRLYKTRLNHSDRLIYSVQGQFESNNLIIKLLQVGNHDFGDKAHHEKNKLTNQALSCDFLDDWNHITDTETQYMPAIASRIYVYLQQEDGLRFTNNSDADLWWQLDEQQQTIRDKQGPIILRGSAGSGKTTIALYRLMQWQVDGNDPCLYVTYSHKLKEYAQTHFNQLNRKPREVLFKTIKELCLDLLPKIQREQFEKSGYVDLIKFEIFIQKHSQKFSAHMLWEEFRGILKGCFYLASQTKKILTLSQYLDLTQIGLAQDDSLFDQDVRKTVYQIFESYQQWLKDSSKWDDLDLARCAFECIKNNQYSYAQILVDEVQDLTTFHLQIILQLTAKPETLFLTGDAHQSIHPSRFRWERLKSQVYTFLQQKQQCHNRYLYNKTNNEVLHIKKNYRCSQEVISLSNALSAWRHSFFGDDKEQLEASGEAVKPIGTLKYSTKIHDDFSDSSNLAVTVMIIVADEAERARLTHKEDGIFRHCSNIVFSIHGSKGLEKDTIILYGFFENYGVDFSKIGDKYHQKNKAKAQHRLRYLVNLFNVACTRARNELILIDSTFPSWQPLNVIKHHDDDVAQNLLKDILLRTSSYDEYVEEAIMLEVNNNWENAAETWKKVNHIKDYHRCMAKYYEEREDWLKTAQNYQLATYFDQAYTYYNKAESYQDAFIALLQMPSSKKQAQDISEFLNNSKKINKLKNDFGKKILDRIIDKDSNLAVSVLFRYSEEKIGLLREPIRKIQGNINNQLISSSDALNRNQQFSASLKQFNSLIGNI